MPMRVSVKWLHQGQHRRFGLELGDKEDGYTALRNRLAALVPGFDRPVAWKDQDGDTIVIGSDLELREAVRDSRDMLLRIATIDDVDAMSTAETPMDDLPAKKAKNDPPTAADDKAKVHTGVFCDGDECERRADKQPIAGVRFKCVQCADYDLCAKCEATGAHRHHAMVRVADPDDHTWKMMVNRHLMRTQRMAARAATLAGDQVPPGVCPFPRGCGRGFGWGPHHHQHGAGNGWGWGPHHRGPMGPPPTHPPSGPPPPPPHDGPMGWPDVLAAVGQQVGQILNNFGVDVDVDVEGGDGERRRVVQSEKDKKKKKHENKTKENKEGKDNDAPMDTAPVENTEKDKQPADATPPTDLVSDETAPSAPPAPKPDQPPASNGNGGEWTVVDKEGDVQIQTAPTVTVRVSSTEPVTYPKLAGAAAEAANTTEATGPAPPQQPIDALIEETVKMLKNMGFNDDHGWLTSLVKSKNGDINAVLNAMHPAK